jgi:two-component system, sensor histidine kinase
MNGANYLKKILLVDDNYVTQVLIDGLLEGLDVNIIKYDRGKDAIRYYRRYGNGIALVLLDIRLPDCMGWDLCKQFRDINDSVPIIAISGVMTAELNQKCEEAGFTAYVSKPFDVEVFMKIVNR